MRNLWLPTDNLETNSRFITGLLDNILLPIILHQLIASAWHQSEMSYYLCGLNRQLNKSNNRDELAKTLYNLYTPSDPESSELKPRPLPWSKERLSQEMRNTQLNFKKYSRDPIYREHTIGRTLAATIYSLIQRTRYFFRTHQIHDIINGKISTLLLRPASLIALPISSGGTITIPYLINIAISEEWLYRNMIQGFLLTTASNRILSFLNLNMSLIILPLIFLRVVTQAIIFAAIHNQNQFHGDLSRFISGMIYGAMYEITGSILPSTAAHLAWNIKANVPMAAMESESEINALPPLNPLSLAAKEKEYFSTLKSDVLQLLLYALAKTLICSIASENYRDLMSPFMLILYGSVAACAYAVKIDHRKKILIPDIITDNVITNHNKSTQNTNQSAFFSASPAMVTVPQAKTIATVPGKHL